MLKKAVPALWLAAGVGGFFLRRKQMMTIFDPETGFAEKGAPVSAMLMTLTVAAIVLAVIFAALQSKNGEKDCVKVFTLGTVPLAVYVLCGAASGAAGVLWIKGQSGLIDLILGALAIAAGVAIILFAISVGRGKMMEGLSAVFAIPTLVFCMWLALIYKENAGNPQIIEFSYEALGVAAATVSMYFAEGYVCGRARPRATLCAGLIAVYMLLVSAGNMESVMEKLLALSAAGMSLVNSVLVLKSMDVKTE